MVLDDRSIASAELGMTCCFESHCTIDALFHSGRPIHNVARGYEPSWRVLPTADRLISLLHLHTALTTHLRILERPLNVDHRDHTQNGIQNATYLLLEKMNT